MEAPVDLVVEDSEHLIQQIIFLELVNQESLIPEEEVLGPIMEVLVVLEEVVLEIPDQMEDQDKEEEEEQEEPIQEAEVVEEQKI